MSYVTRFAPSPTGYLHLGHAFSALTAFEAARANGGRFVLRIEDIDHTRCRPEYVQAIFDDLSWLGIAWEAPVLHQSAYLDDYQAALDRLRDMGVLYADSKTRKAQVEAALSAPQEGDTEAVMRREGPPAWRLSLEAARDVLGVRYEGLSFTDKGTAHPVRPEINGDVVLGRKDIGVAYHLCVVVDDARQGITHIHRGMDLFDATHTQVLLQALLELPTPEYHHHPLLLDDQGRRLAKRKGSKSLRDYRLEGIGKDEVIQIIQRCKKT